MIICSYRRTAALLFVFLSMFFLAGCFKNSQSVEIFFIPALAGNIFGCECKEPNPGFSRSAYAIKQRTGELGRKSSIVLASPDFLTPFKSEGLTELIIDCYNRLPFDAVGMGRGEIVNTVDSLPGAQTLPFVSSNYMPDSPNRGVKKWIILKNKKIKTGVFSLVDPGAEKEGGKTPELEVLASARQVINILKAEECRLIILLSALTPGQETLLARDLEIDLIISANGEYYKKETRTGNTLIVSSLKVPVVIKAVHKEGLINLTGRKMEISFKNTPEDEYIKEKTEAFLQSLGK